MYKFGVSAVHFLGLLIAKSVDNLPEPFTAEETISLPVSSNNFRLTVPFPTKFNATLSDASLYWLSNSGVTRISCIYFLFRVYR